MQLKKVVNHGGVSLPTSRDNEANVSFPFSFQFCTHLAAVFAEEVGGDAFKQIAAM